MSKPHFKPLDPVSKLVIALKAHKIFNSDKDIANFSGLPLPFISSLPQHPNYQEIFENESAKYLEKRMLEGDMDFEGLMNSEIKNSLFSLIALRDSTTVKDAVKLKAIQEILDRAEDAPRIRKNEGDISDRVILQIPYAQVETIKQLADEEGHSDLIEMLENENFDEEQ